MDQISGLLILVVVLVAIFDFTNGFHDASNIIATVIASRAMTPVQAVIIVATFEFLGPMLGGTAVANTIADGGAVLVAAGPDFAHDAGFGIFIAQNGHFQFTAVNPLLYHNPPVVSF